MDVIADHQLLVLDRWIKNEEYVKNLPKLIDQVQSDFPSQIPEKFYQELRENVLMESHLGDF